MHHHTLRDSIATLCDDVSEQHPVRPRQRARRNDELFLRRLGSPVERQRATGDNQYNRSWTYDALGNMQTRVENGATTNYSYDPNHKHAVSSAGSATYQYDANGNMTNRAGDTLTYDVENRLTNVVKGGVTTSFAYNGDGTRVKRSVSNAGTTYYIGNYFEVWVPNSGTTTFNKYYYFGKQRIALRNSSGMVYLHSDHLGSISATSGATSSAGASANFAGTAATAICFRMLATRIL